MRLLLALLFQLLLPALVQVLRHWGILTIYYLPADQGHSHVRTKILGRHWVSECRLLILADWAEGSSRNLRLRVLESGGIDLDFLFGLDMVGLLYFLFLVESLRHGFIEILLRELALIFPRYFEIVDLLGFVVVGDRRSFVVVEMSLVRSEVLHFPPSTCFWVCRWIAVLRNIKL